MKLASIILTLITSIQSQACSCYRDRTIEDLANSASEIFLGKISETKKVGAVVQSGEMQDYEVTVKKTKVYKGKPLKSYDFKGKAIYNETDAKVITVGDCSQDMTIGSEFVIMLEEGHDIFWGWCEQHIIPAESNAYLYFKKNMADWLGTP